MGWWPPLHPPPHRVFHGLGMELPGNPIPKPRMLEQSIPHSPASPGHQGRAAGGSPRAGFASSRFPRAGKSPKKAQIFKF